MQEINIIESYCQGNSILYLRYSSMFKCNPTEGEQF